MADVREHCLHAFQVSQKDNAQKLLLKVHQPQCDKDDHNWTHGHFAAYHRWCDIFQTMIEISHLNPTEKDDHGLPPLCWACLNCTQMIKYLLALPAVLLTVDDDVLGGWHTLDYA